MKVQYTNYHDKLFDVWVSGRDKWDNHYKEWVEQTCNCKFHDISGGPWTLEFENEREAVNFMLKFGGQGV